MKNEFNGPMFQSLESNNDLSISYEIIDGQQVTNNINLEKIASYTSYTKEDLPVLTFWIIKERLRKCL